jgi:flagellar motor switch protein FliM
MPAEALPLEPSADPLEPPLTPLPEDKAAAASAAAANITPLPVPAPDSGPAIQPFNFRQPSFLTPGQWRKLTLRHEEFVRALMTRFCIYLRMDFGVRLESSQNMFASKLVSLLPAQSQYTLFKLDPLPGTGLIEMSPSFGLAMVDRLCGGSGQIKDVTRDLTEIETALLDQTIRLLLKEWAQVVAGMPESNPDFCGHETNARYLPSAPADSGMIVLALEARLGERTGSIRLGFPFEMIAPLGGQWSAPVEAKPAKAFVPPTPLRWNPELNAVKVPLSAEWADLEITARQLAQLKVGDVLPVEPLRLNRTLVRLSKITKFLGRIGKCGRTWAIEITEPVNS